MGPEKGESPVTLPPDRGRPSGRESCAHGLMYHGLYSDPAHGPLGRRPYDVSAHAFAQHLEAIAAGVARAPSTNLGCSSAATQWAITFDDGLASAIKAADLLEAAGWRGYFFIVSSWVGQQGYLSSSQIVELRDRGHVIGSHSSSHPDPMSRLPRASVVDEWRRSVGKLGDILGERVATAAVPGGGYSSKVAAAAAEAGIEVLFTSEPVSKTCCVQGCTVVGRYAVRRSTSAATVAALATGSSSVCGAQWLSWNSKKLAKNLLGSSYYTVRARMLDKNAGGRP